MTLGFGLGFRAHGHGLVRFGVSGVGFHEVSGVGSREFEEESLWFRRSSSEFPVNVGCRRRSCSLNRLHGT